MSYASYAAELLDQVIADSQPDEALFRLILQSMYLLEHISPWLAVRHLELRLLELHGVQGGALCPFCSHGQQGGAALTLEALTILKSFDFMPLHRLGWVYCSQEGRQSLEGYMELQLQQVLNWRLKSRDFLKQMDL